MVLFIYLFIYSLFFNLILKKETKHVNTVFEFTIKKTQWNNYFNS